MRFSEAAKEARTDSAMTACSTRGSKSGYKLPTRPVSSKAWATSSAVGNVSPRSGSAARTSASGFGLCSMAPTRSLRSARNENGRSSGKSPASSGSPAAIASVVLLAASKDASDDTPKSQSATCVSAKCSNTMEVGHCSRGAMRAISRTSGAGMACTAASRMRNRLHVAATSASARCVDGGRPNARTRSSRRCDFMRGKDMRARSSESIHVFSSSG